MQTTQLKNEKPVYEFAGDLSTIIDTDESRSEQGTKFVDYFDDREICRDFIRGKCTRQAYFCRYSHDIEFHESERIANGPCLTHFRFRRCRKGKACKFTHDAEWLRQQRIENGRCRAFVMDHCKSGKACEFFHDRKLKGLFNKQPEKFGLHRLIVERPQIN